MLRQIKFTSYLNPELIPYLSSQVIFRFEHQTMDCIAWLKDVRYAFKLSNSCCQMGTDHSQWKCVAYFLSPGLQKESFECVTAGLKGHSEVSVALTSPTWALPRPRVQLSTARALLQECWAPAQPCSCLAMDCWSRMEPLSWFPGLTLAPTGHLNPWDEPSPTLPAVWSQPSGSRWPTAYPRGTVSRTLLLAWATGSFIAWGCSWWRGFLSEMICK